MARITISCLIISTIVVLAAFGQGMGVLRGGDVSAHLKWALASLIAVLVANFVAIVHAASSDRIIRSLRQQSEGTPDQRRQP
jgi:hypothetical protein